MSFKEMIFKIAGILRKYWKPIILFVFAFFIIIPICINVAYKYDSGIVFLQAEWCASDALGFYGGILAAGLGICGVFLSIQYAQKNYRQDEKNRVRPYMALTYLRERTNTNLLDILGYTDEPKEKNFESANTTDLQYRLTSVAIVLQEGEILYQSDLTESQKILIERQGFVTTQGKVIKRRYISMPFQIDNVGAGAAINFRIAFFEENTTPKGINFHTVKCGDAVYCHIFSEMPGSFLNKKYILKFAYKDILETEYNQMYDITFEIDPETKLIAHKILLNGEQQEKSIWNI